jgi:hypothetical protein
VYRPHHIVSGKIQSHKSNLTNDFGHLNGFRPQMDLIIIIIVGALVGSRNEMNGTPIISHFGRMYMASFLIIKSG